MKDQIEKLDKLWEKERASLDYTALKEVRFEFDQADKQVRNIINDWDRRKYSDVLADHLFDLHDQLFQVYFDKYTKMADEKRQEANDQRRRERCCHSCHNYFADPFQWYRNVILNGRWTVGVLGLQYH